MKQENVIHNQDTSIKRHLDGLHISQPARSFLNSLPTVSMRNNKIGVIV